jgi:hypothetical protein
VLIAAAPSQKKLLFKFFSIGKSTSIIGKVTYLSGLLKWAILNLRTMAERKDWLKQNHEDLHRQATQTQLYLSVPANRARMGFATYSPQGDWLDTVFADAFAAGKSTTLIELGTTPKIFLILHLLKFWLCNKRMMKP